jgi:hypothetical protein
MLQRTVPALIEACELLSRRARLGAAALELRSSTSDGQVDTRRRRLSSAPPTLGLLGSDFFRGPALS